MDTAIDFTAIKQQQRIGWQTANYARVSNTLQIMAELLVDEERRARFHDDLAELAGAYNRATDGTVAAVADYLEAVGTRTA